ncbi:glycosyltransferase family 61 protein [Acidocella aminolytica]|uniref:Capsule polysaccharide biosynthesis protein n=1 Tax=Acidocella aminolytica 101 = DSM 11237 TaxID=1120923 RepID=A0A0D6PH94_9PROT|nr:glycosyltransferase 61 family protein [Acidocella aminolytica]GAN81120.1 capsule polysaccharide biosynthesis protein [Acidocella aminolytica 101 = DSM 11237]GBQ38981.1 capsular polysaccharide biosynthesis protein-like protein [Acidocella aminolytica 101 = DSM 11237]
MSPGEIIGLGHLEKVGEVAAFAQYMTYPALYQKHLIPDEALGILSHRWSIERNVIPNAEFHLARNVYIVGEGLVFTSEGALINATRINFSDADVERARATLAEALNSGQNPPHHGRAIMCKKRGATNYGHWLVEMLPKAFWIRNKLNAWDWPVVVHQNGLKMQTIMRQSLAALGVTSDKIIETGPEVVHFDELLLVHGLTSHAVFISPLVMECMEFIASKAPPGKADMIYAMRSPAHIRDFEDEPAIRAIFEGHGYAPIDTAPLSFLEQVSAFKTARRVVGAMGAALSNSIFCRPGTELVMFTPSSALELFFWHIAQGRKLDYHEVRTEEAGPQIGSLPWNKNLCISAEAVENILARLAVQRQQTILPLTEQPTATHLTRECACAVQWGLSFQNKRDMVHTIRLKPDGTTTGYRHHNEHSWRFKDGAIEILSIHGQLSWRFDDIGQRDEKLHLRARGRLPELAGLLAYLDELPSTETTLSG